MFYIHLTQRYYQYALKLIFLAFFLVLAPFWIFQLWNKDEDSSGAFQLEDILNHCNIEKPNSKQIWSVPPTSGYDGHVYPELTYTYDDPLTYTGPIVRGWEPHKSRNITPYIRPSENTVKLDPVNCGRKNKAKIELVILQFSAPSNFEIRMTNRLTWMQYAQHMPVWILFVIGIPAISVGDLDFIDKKVQQEIDEEYTKFGDIVQVDSFELYGNNTLKSLHALKFLLGLDWKRLSDDGNPPRFVMRADDDVYINLPLVQKIILDNKQWISHGTTHKPPMIGDVLDYQVVPGIPKKLMKEKYSPKTWLYECPTYFHSGNKFYPNYLQGAGYFIPWWSISCLYQQSFHLPYFFVDDVFLGGWMADRCSVSKYHQQGFTMYRPNKPIEKIDANFDIMFHYVDKTYKMEAHRVLTNAYSG